MKVTTVITTHNEADTIGTLVKDCLTLTDEVVVIDERSTDDTRGLAKDAGAAIVRARAGGIGPCLLAGMRIALGRGAALIVTIDAGGSHDPHDIERLVQSARFHDVIVGSRYADLALYRGRWWRKVASRLYGALWGWKTAVRVKDWTSGYRVYPKEVAGRLVRRQYVGRMHAWQAEILATACQMGYTVCEEPITYRAGRSSMNRKHAKEAWKVWRAWKV